MGPDGRDRTGRGFEPSEEGVVMVDSISNNATGLTGMNLLQSAGGTDSLFGTLAGNNTDNSAAGLFSALAGGDGTPTSVAAILRKQEIATSKNQIYVNAGQTLAAIQLGQIQPTTDWQKVAGYAMAKGLPVTISLDTSGQVQALLQSESDMSTTFNVHQQAQIQDTISQIGVMAQKIQANEKNQRWLSNLKGAETDLYYVYNNMLAPQSSTPNNWEQSGVLMMQMHKPFRISLDTKGDLQVIDQIQDPALAKLPYTQQKKLINAIETIPDIIRSGEATETWQMKAIQLSDSGYPFYLDIDPTTGDVVCKENNADNITPKFLKTDPYPDVGDDSKVLKEAADLIKAGKPYFLDIDSTGQLGAKEATGQNIVKYNGRTNGVLTTPKLGAVLSLFA
jgi:hypothetical protein